MIERTFIEQGMRKIQLEKYLKKELDRAGFTGLDMVKTPLVTRIVLHVARPGLAIGRGGQNIRQLTEEIGQKFGIENPQIEIQDIKQPELDAKATVDKMVGLLERGYSWRSVAFNTIRNITEAGAQGVELVLKGKLSGKGGRKRKQRIAQGYMKKVGNQVKLVDYAKASAYPKAGAIGIKLSIIRPETVFPDKVNIKEIIKSQQDKEKAEKEAQKEKEAAEEKEKAQEKKGSENEAEEKAGKEQEKKKGNAEKKEEKKKHEGEEKTASEKEAEEKKTEGKKPGKEEKEKKKEAVKKSGKEEKK
ncbi:MAG: 30S ribosomal protein S3 [Candidatus Diapherotrites archaeon]|uniref:Small ribosomal subunit protein uS3 n=1 Tax=Candidatus Iainarchaeum sp. TaxID=3101447 RepID=A0A939C459_9ARCH|nr:30S ribosomal protein S3 [Candidatus Diapherotrites archaeon]